MILHHWAIVRIQWDNVGNGHKMFIGNGLFSEGAWKKWGIFFPTLSLPLVLSPSFCVEWGSKVGKWCAQVTPTPFPSHSQPQHPAPSQSPDFYPIPSFSLLLGCEPLMPATLEFHFSGSLWASPAQALPGPHPCDQPTQYSCRGASRTPRWKFNSISQKVSIKGDAWALFSGLLRVLNWSPNHQH